MKPDDDGNLQFVLAEYTPDVAPKDASDCVINIGGERYSFEKMRTNKDIGYMPIIRFLPEGSTCEEIIHRMKEEIFPSPEKGYDLNALTQPSKQIKVEETTDQLVFSPPWTIETKLFVSFENFPEVSTEKFVVFTFTGKVSYSNEIAAILIEKCSLV